MFVAPVLVQLPIRSLQPLTSHCTHVPLHHDTHKTHQAACCPSNCPFISLLPHAGRWDAWEHICGRLGGVKKGAVEITGKSGGEASLCPLLLHYLPYFLGKAGGSWSWQFPRA